MCHVGAIARDLIQHFIEPARQYLERQIALKFLIIDEKGRRRLHAEHVAGIFLALENLPLPHPPVQAGLKLRRRYALGRADCGNRL